MSKLKIESGVSRIKRAKLQSSIDQTIARDIELMAQWSDNEPNYIVNELLRFAITQAEEFQQYKVGLPTNTVDRNRDAASVPAASKAVSTIATHPSKEEPSHAS